ncbi:MAG TPA: hypothetical protein VN253_20735 [Kofleriaceae bacterium]|nr:hypothetical protein [Kofleriaceae bacterium]
MPQASQFSGAPARPVETGALAEGPAGAGGADINAPPVEKYVIPFDRNPKSAPGEQIIFGATYTHATPNAYKLVYTSSGGHFDAQGSNVTTKTINGLNARNIYWFIASNWDGRTAVTMKLELKKADDTVVATTNWTFSKKPYHPTTIAQQETEGERDNPAIYRYKLGPSRNSGGDDYLGFTILEKFAGPYTTNLKLTDLRPSYVQAHGLSSDDAIAPHFFPGTGDNGTFTVSQGDLIADQHGGMAGADEAKAQLAAPKEIQKLLTQTYESEAGTALATYQITRTMKLDGSKKITKKKV